MTDHADSIFHAGQVRLTRRFARGMSAVALYTFSKSIDDASTFAGGTGGTVIQNPNDFSADRGLSSFDQRHNFTLLTCCPRRWESTDYSGTAAGRLRPSPDGPSTAPSRRTPAIRSRL